MNEIKEKGTTILLVTHDLSSVVKYCDRAVLLNKGRMIKEGKPKKIVDIYKKILVNQFDENSDGENDKDVSALETETGNAKKRWRDHMVTATGEETVYGNSKASIIDFGLFDENGKITNIVMKKSDFTLKMKVRFNTDVKQPIFAYTFKNEKGVEITGTNSMFEKYDIHDVKAGEVYVVEFEQNMNLQGGEYLLSFGCTGFENDEFVVYDRLYDITNVTVVSEQNTVGYYDMDSKVSITPDNDGE